MAHSPTKTREVNALGGGNARGDVRLCNRTAPLPSSFPRTLLAVAPGRCAASLPSVLGPTLANLVEFAGMERGVLGQEEHSLGIAREFMSLIPGP